MSDALRILELLEQVRAAARDDVERRRAAFLVVNALVHDWAPPLLEELGLEEKAKQLRALAEVKDEESAREVMRELDARVGDEDRARYKGYGGYARGLSSLSRAVYDVSVIDDPARILEHVCWPAGPTVMCLTRLIHDGASPPELNAEKLVATAQA